MKQREILSRAKTAFRLGDYPLAEKLTASYFKNNPQSTQAHNLLGSIYSNENKITKAIQEFEKTLTIDPENFEAYNNLGVLYRKKGKFKQSLKAFQQALAINSESSDVHYNLGNILKSLGKNEHAIKSYRKAIHLRPDFTQAYNNLGTLYEGTGKINEAVEIYQTGLSEDKNNPTLRYNLGIAYESQGKAADAEKEYLEAVRVKPGWINGLNNLGIIYQESGKYNESLRTFQDILKIEPDNYIANNNIATAFVKQGRTEEAKDYYKTALDKKPGYAKAAINLSQIFQKDGDYDTAQNVLAKALTDNNEEPELQYSSARNLIRLKRYDEAEKHLHTYLESNPKSIPGLQTIGSLYYRMGKEDDGDKYFDSIKKIDPENSDYMMEIACALSDNQDYSKAIDKIEKYLHKNPDNKKANKILGDIHFEKGDFESSIGVYSKLKEQFPDDGGILASLAKVYNKKGERQEAIQTVDNLVNLQGNRATPEDISDLNRSLELYEQTVKAFEEEHTEEWEKNLERLGRLVSGENGTPEPAQDSDFKADVLPELEEESVPILDFGDEEIIFEEENDEDIEDPDTEELEDESPPSLLKLLDDQELYPDSPNIQIQNVPSDFGSAAEENGEDLTEGEMDFLSAGDADESGAEGAEAEEETFGDEGQPLEPGIPAFPEEEALYPNQDIMPQMAPEELPPEEAGDGDDEAEEDVDEDVASDEETMEDQETEPSEGEGGPSPDDPASDGGENTPADEEDDGPGGGLGNRMAPHRPQMPIPPQQTKRRFPDKKAQAGLFDYLLDMTKSLPAQKKNQFSMSDIRLKMESIRGKLKGKPGIKKDIETKHPEKSIPKNISITPNKVNKAFSFIRDISGSYPDKSIAQSIKSVMSNLVKKISNLGTKKDT
jgi:tetratricopeptide (TPR) repeat protein